MDDNEYGINKPEHFHDFADRENIYRYLTREEFDKYQANIIREFGEDKVDSAEFVSVCFSVLKTEIACIEAHFDDGEWEGVLRHLRTIRQGLDQIYHAIIYQVLDPLEATKILAGLTAELMTQNTGVPHSIREVAPNVYAIDQDEVAVPNDLSGLDDAGN